MKKLFHTQKQGRFHAVLLSAVLILSLFAGRFAVGDVNAQTNSTENQDLYGLIETTAAEFITQNFDVSSAENELTITNLQIADTSARVDVLLILNGELGQFEENVRIYMLHNGSEIEQVFSEPSNEYYTYIDYVSPEIVDHSTVDMWKDLREQELLDNGFAPRTTEHDNELTAQTTELYYLPWDWGYRYLVYQDWNKHYDFQTPIGITIRASRGGVVFNGVGSSGETYVRITHSDGTYAFYVHLQANSFKASHGSTVPRGTPIGISGNTGISSGPHTHFNVTTSSSNSNAGTPFGSGWIAVTFKEGPTTQTQNGAAPQYTPYSLNYPPPQSPTNLKVMTTGSDRFTLTWVLSPDDNTLNEYNIYKDGIYIASVPKGTSLYSLTGLPCNTKHTFFVRAKREGLQSPRTAEVSAFTSACVYPSQDGYILEKSEFSNSGGSLNTKDGRAIVGDATGDRQYRAFLSFNTILPSNAVIQKVILKIKHEVIVGTNPFKTHGKLVVDIRKGPFSGNSALQLKDFNAFANQLNIGSFPSTPYYSWYILELNSSTYQHINRSGITQFRIRFSKEDDDDGKADQLKFFTGNARPQDAPQLIIEHYVP